VHRDYYEAYWSAEGFNPEGGLGPETRSLLAGVLPKGSRIVDVGCGDGGGLGRWARKRGFEYLGLDISEAALAKARELGLTVERIEDAASLPLRDGEAGAVTCLEVLEHLLNPMDAVLEIKRVLAPGGVLVATVPNAAYWVRRVELGILGRFNPYGDARSKDEPWRDPHVRFFTRRTLVGMMRMAGFEDVSVSAESHPVFSLRTRIESSRPYRVLMRRLPALLAPTLLVMARVPTRQDQ
jgi:SAM-dependent methyltransferase